MRTNEKIAREIVDSWGRPGCGGYDNFVRDIIAAYDYLTAHIQDQEGE